MESSILIGCLKSCDHFQPTGMLQFQLRVNWDFKYFLSDRVLLCFQPNLAAAKICKGPWCFRNWIYFYFGAILKIALFAAVAASTKVARTHFVAATCHTLIRLEGQLVTFTPVKLIRIVIYKSRYLSFIEWAPKIWEGSSAKLFFSDRIDFWTK